MIAGRKKHITIILLLILVCFASVCVYLGKHVESDRIELGISHIKNQEVISIWSKNGEEYYFFLPSYMDLESSRMVLSTEKTVFLNGNRINNGASCAVLKLNYPYTLSYEVYGRKCDATLTFLQSANVSAMYIDTQSESMDYIHAQKGNKESGAFRVYNPDGTLDCDGEIASIKGRGNNSWYSFEKKSYSVTLAQERNILTLGQASEWILLANASDASHIRNKLAVDIANSLFLPYNPDSKWVDLYLNEEYVGLYQLSERNEIHPERVDISKESGVLVSLELQSRLDEQNIPYVLTDHGQALRVHYPNATQNSTKLIQEKWEIVEESIISAYGNGTISSEEYEKVIDLDSWSKKYLLEEVLGNLDACRISQYFYYEPSSKVFAGPVWDLDLSMGNKQIWQLLCPECICGNRTYDKEDVSTLWFYSLCQTNEFWNNVLNIYETSLRPMLFDLLNNKLQEYQTKLVQSAYMNQIRWSEKVSIEEEIAYIREYMLQRIAFFDRYWLENQEYCVVYINDGRNSGSACWMVLQGTELTGIPVLKPWDGYVFLGWFYSASDEPFDITRPINEDIEIYARWAETGEKRIVRILTLLPLCAIVALGIGLLITDIKFNRTKS